jgi:hypothetical protein
MAPSAPPRPLTQDERGWLMNGTVFKFRLPSVRERSQATLVLATTEAQLNRVVQNAERVVYHPKLLHAYIARGTGATSSVADCDPEGDSVECDAVTRNPDLSLQDLGVLAASGSGSGSGVHLAAPVLERNRMSPTRTTVQRRRIAGRFVRKCVRAGIKAGASEHDDSLSDGGGPEYVPQDELAHDVVVSVPPPRVNGIPSDCHPDSMAQQDLGVTLIRSVDSEQ